MKRIKWILLAAFILPPIIQAGPLNVANSDTLKTEIHQERISGTTVTFDMVRVPGGTLEIEQEGETKSVLVKPFWIGATEVTWDLYDVYVFEQEKSDREGVDAVSRPSKPYALPGESFGHRGLPALGMTDRAADRFVEWLSAVTGNNYRLLTEDEWEYACKMGDVMDKPIESVAWYWDNAQDRTHAVATRSADAIGLYDMLGNAAEWVQGRDGKMVVKGGSWKDEAHDVNCFTRARQTRSWNATDPQIPKSRWWLSDGHFLTMRVAMEEGSGTATSM